MSVSVRFTAIRANARIIPTPEVRAALDEYTQLYCEKVIVEVSEYPPPVPYRPGRQYIRTFKLLKSWRLRNVSNAANIQWQINNPAQDPWNRYYSGYVHGGPGRHQASFHAEHGWKNLNDVMDREEFKEGAQATMLATVK